MRLKTRKLGELGDFRNGLNYSKEDFGVGLKVISVKDFGDRWKPDITDLDEINPARVRANKSDLRTGDILFVRSNGNRDLVGRSMFIHEDLENVSFSGFCIRFRPFDGQCNPRYLALFFRTPQFRKVLSLQGGGTNINNLSQPLLERMDVPWPSGSVEGRIVDFIGTYNDLIENNRRRIALLEQAARLLYEEWFVRFRFPGYEHTKFINGLPVGWKRPLLGVYAPLQYGKALREDLRVDGDVPVYGSSGVVGAHNKAFVDEPAIIIGRKGNVGAVYFAEAPSWPIDTTYFINNENVSRFLFHALQRVQFINTDVAVPGLNRDYAHSRNLTVPTGSILVQYEETVAPIFAMVKNLVRQNLQLAQSRDLLLPRLMSGEVEV